MSAAAVPRLHEPARLVPPPIEVRAEARSPWAVGFGPRFFLLLLIGLVWVGPAWWEPRFLLAMAAWDALALIAWAWDLERLPRPEELVVRRLWSAPAAFRTTVQVAVVLENLGGVAVLTEATADVPPSLVPQPPVLALRAARGKPGRADFAIFPIERGDARLGRVFLRYQSPLRVAERWASADLAQTVRVYPNLEEAKRQTIYLIRSRQVELEKRLKRQRGLGHEFESLREYREGDEWRDICWTATARRARLVTKVYQVERSQAVWLVLDAGRLLRARAEGPSKLDYAVSAALSLAHVALYSGDRVGLLAYGRRIQQRLAAGRGSAHLRALVEQLALVRTEPYEADHGRAAQELLATQKRRSLIVWLTDLAETPATPDVIENVLQMTSRHLVLFGVIGQPELAELVARVPANASELYRHVAALEIVHRRELLLRRLRQQGALAMEFLPGQLSTALVNQYLEIKERSLL